MKNNICEKCKKEVKEPYYVGLKRMILCKKCYDEKMFKEIVEQLKNTTNDRYVTFKGNTILIGKKKKDE